MVAGILEVVEAWIVWRSKDDPNGAHEAWKHATLKNNTNTAHRLAREIGKDRPAESVTAEELHELIANGLQPMRNGKIIEGRETSRKMRARIPQRSPERRATWRPSNATASHCRLRSISTRCASRSASQLPRSTRCRAGDDVRRLG